MSAITALSSVYDAISSATAMKARRSNRDGDIAADAAKVGDGALAGHGAVKPAQASDAQSATPTLTVAKFSDMYKGRVLAAMDQNNDQKVSLEEFTRQTVAGGGSSTRAGELYANLDQDGDGAVSATEFTDSLSDPFAKLGYSHKIDELLAQIANGQSTAPVTGAMFDAHGQVSNSDQVLRNLAQQFPGNL